MLQQNEALILDSVKLFYTQVCSTMEQNCLYNLEPIGIGTTFVESLTSYVGRLGLAHCVLSGTLITKILAPIMNKDYLVQSSIAGGSRFYESSAPINSLRKEANDWVNALEMLTSRTDLRFLTMLPWAEIFPVRNLVKRNRAWCPKCLSDQERGQEYEPLIWNLQVVERCPIHRSMLETKCPTCGKNNYVMSRKHLPGYCNKCLSWLGEHYSCECCLIDNSDENEDYNDKDQMLLHLEFLIQYPLQSILKVNTVDRLNFLLTKATDGNISSFAKTIGKPKNTVWGWINAKNKATLKDIFIICDAFGITLQEFYFGELEEKRIKASKKNRDTKLTLPKNKRSELDFDKISVQLEEYSRRDEAPSMRQVAKTLNINQRTLYNRYPLICQDIAHRYLEKNNNEKTKKMQVDCERVNEAVITLLNQGLYPSRRKVEEKIGSPLLRRREVQQFWKDLLNKL